jgi:DNA-binding SARP family transcriptional activator
VLGVSATQRRQLRQLARPCGPEPVTPSGPASVSVLGPLSVSWPAGSVELGSGRHRVVLARLAPAPRQPVGREELIHLLWGDDPPRSAANVVQTHLSRLRRILEPPGHRGPRTMLTSTPGGYRLQIDDDLDVLRYRSRDPAGVLIADETGFVKKGTASAGVQRPATKPRSTNNSESGSHMNQASA